MALTSVVLLMFVWGSSFLLTKTAVREIPPFTLGVLRFAFAAAALAPIAAFRGGLTGLPRPIPLRPIVIMAITGVTLFSIAFNYSMVWGSVSQGALIYALTPAAVAIAAVIGLSERISTRRILGICLSIAGVLLVIASGRPGANAPRPLLGALAMLTVVIGWAIYNVAAKRVAEVDQAVLMMWVCIVGTVLLVPLAGWEIFHDGWPGISMKAWLGTAFLGVFASGLAFVVYNSALRELDVSVMGALSNLDPIVGVASAVVFLGEVLGTWQIVGGIGALGGMWLASVERKRVSLT